jgi:hypothetical protein
VGAFPQARRRAAARRERVYILGMSDLTKKIWLAGFGGFLLGIACCLFAMWVVLPNGETGPLRVTAEQEAQADSIIDSIKAAAATVTTTLAAPDTNALFLSTTSIPPSMFDDWIVNASCLKDPNAPKSFRWRVSAQWRGKHYYTGAATCPEAYRRLDEISVEERGRHCCIDG